MLQQADDQVGPDGPVDSSSGFVDEWRAQAAFAASLTDAAAPATVLLDHALPSADLVAVARAVGIDLSDNDRLAIRNVAAEKLGQLFAGRISSKDSTLLTRARRESRAVAATKLGLLAASNGIERAAVLSPTFKPARRMRDLLSSPGLWATLIAGHWTLLPVFTESDFHGWLFRTLPSKPNLLIRSIDAIASRGEVGGAGGAETAAVLAATTAATAE